MFPEGAQGERSGQEGQLLDAGPRVWGHVREGELPAEEEGEEALQTRERALPEREPRGVPRASLPAALRELLGSVPERIPGTPQHVPQPPGELLLPATPLPPHRLRRLPPPPARAGPPQRVSLRRSDPADEPGWRHRLRAVQLPAVHLLRAAGGGAAPSPVRHVRFWFVCATDSHHWLKVHLFHHFSSAVIHVSGKVNYLVVWWVFNVLAV